jgi:hypothetical protein
MGAQAARVRHSTEEAMVAKRVMPAPTATAAPGVFTALVEKIRVFAQ